VNIKNELKGQMSFGGRTYNVQGTADQPLLLLRR
jgi:hypothetical protein